MVAYVLQMLFAALSLFSIVVIVVMILKDMRTTKKQWWMLFVPILLLFATIAFRFPWETNTNNDLARYIQDFKGMRQQGFLYEMQHADEYSWFWRLIAYVFCNFENYHWFPAFTVALEYLIFFYILADATEKNNLSAVDVSLCLLLRLSFLPLIMSIAASRNTLAYAFFSLGIYMYYKYGLKNLRMYVWMLLGVLTHTTVVIGVAIFALSLLAQRYRITLLLFLPIGVLLGNVLVPILEMSTNEYLRFFVEKWDMYTNNPNNFDITKNEMIIPGLLLLLLLAGYWFLSRNASPKKERTGYLLSNMAVTIGVYGVMAELFLRLCYPTSFLMPALWGEFKQTVWKNGKSGMVFLLLLIVSVVVLFISTGAGWLWQLEWFFEL